MLFLIHWKPFEFSTRLTREMFIWLKNSTVGISNSEVFHYLHCRLVADYPGHMTTYFRTQCQRPVHPKDLICDIWHSIKIKYPYSKPQSPTPFNSNSHPSHFCTKLWSKTDIVLLIYFIFECASWTNILQAKEKQRFGSGLLDKYSTIGHVGSKCSRWENM